MYITSYDRTTPIQPGSQIGKPRLFLNYRHILCKNPVRKRTVAHEINNNNFTPLQTYHLFQQRQRRKKQMKQAQNDNTYVAVYCLDYRRIKDKLQKQKKVVESTPQKTRIRRSLSTKTEKRSLKLQSSHKEEHKEEGQYRDKERRRKVLNIRMRGSFTRVLTAKSSPQKNESIQWKDIRKQVKNDENARIRYSLGRQKLIDLQVENVDPWLVKSYFQDDIKF